MDLIGFNWIQLDSIGCNWETTFPIQNFVLNSIYNAQKKLILFLNWKAEICSIQFLQMIKKAFRIEMDSDFQKYWFERMLKCYECFSILNAFFFIYRNCMELIYGTVPFNLKIILAFSMHNNTIVNTVQFKILNRKCSFSIQLHLIESNWIQLNPKKRI